MNTYAYDWSGRETGETWYASTTRPTDADPDGTISYSFDVEGNMLSAANTADGSAVATYTYTNNRVGQALVDDMQLGDLSSTAANVVMGMNYDYNGDRTSLAANIGGSATISEDAVSGFTGGTNDFLDTYGYDKLGDMTSVSQTGNGGNGVAVKTVVLGYDNDQRMTSVDSYAADSVEDSDSGNEVVFGGLHIRQRFAAYRPDLYATPRAPSSPAITGTTRQQRRERRVFLRRHVRLAQRRRLHHLG